MDFSLKLVGISIGGTGIGVVFWLYKFCKRRFSFFGCVVVMQKVVLCC